MTSLKSHSLSEWMTNLPHEITSKPLNELAIPGSHDSFTSSITDHCVPSPDGDCYNVVRNLPQIIAGPMLRPWTTTQGLTMLDQLHCGIRYLDLRVAVRPGMNGVESLYLVHGQYVCPVIEGLRSLVQFLRDHPREVLLLDCNHCYQFETSQHVQNFESTVYEVLEPFLYPSQASVPNLEEVWMSGKQVLFFSSLHPEGTEKLWSGKRMVSLWPNTVNVDKMIRFLDERCGPQFVRDPKKFYVFQGVLTPNAEYILQNLRGSLRRLSKDAGDAFSKWLRMPERVAGLKGLNVTLIDFVATDFPDYAPSVIHLNYKTWAVHLKPPSLYVTHNLQQS